MNDSTYYEIEVYVPDHKEPVYITSYIEYSWSVDLASFLDDLLYETCEAFYEDCELEMDWGEYYYLSECKVNELTPAEYKEKYGDF